jgi:hypothetical protein
MDFYPSNSAFCDAKYAESGKRLYGPVNEAEWILSNAVAARSLAFKPFRTLTTRINNAVKALGVSQLTIELFYLAPIRLKSLDLIFKYNYSGKFCEGCCGCASIGLGSL